MGFVAAVLLGLFLAAVVLIIMLRAKSSVMTHSRRSVQSLLILGVVFVTVTEHARCEFHVTVAHSLVPPSPVPQVVIVVWLHRRRTHGRFRQPLEITWQALHDAGITTDQVEEDRQRRGVIHLRDTELLSILVSVKHFEEVQKKVPLKRLLALCGEVRGWGRGSHPAYVEQISVRGESFYDTIVGADPW